MIQISWQKRIYSGYTSALGDKYTVYYDEDETKALMESTSGTFSGVGATLTKDADTGYATIVNVYEDSPAEKAGLKAGDILEKIDDHEVGDEQLDTVVSWIKGEKGTDVKITVLRDGEELELTATRDTIEVKTVSYEMKENQIGYIRVSEFDTVTYDQFKEALDDLEKQGMQGLIVDLRNNPGEVLIQLRICCVCFFRSVQLYQQRTRMERQTKSLVTELMNLRNQWQFL